MPENIEFKVKKEEEKKYYKASLKLKGPAGSVVVEEMIVAETGEDPKEKMRLLAKSKFSSFAKQIEQARISVDPVSHKQYWQAVIVKDRMSKKSVEE